jgi:DNA-binding beta-propeller fold protein YncE
MVVLDSKTGAVETTIKIGKGVDATAYDWSSHKAFASNGDGTLTVVDVQSSEKIKLFENAHTARGSRTMALDPATHTIYLATAQFGATPAATTDHPHPRPAIVEGSFKILIVRAN